VFAAGFLKFKLSRRTDYYKGILVAIFELDGRKRAL